MVAAAASEGGMLACHETRVLIVGDERARLRALCDAIGLEGHAITRYVSGREALKELRAGEFDLLITDLTMPALERIALASAAREIDPALAIILLAADGTIDAAGCPLQDGMFDYVLGSFTVGAIMATVSRALEMRQLRREISRLVERERCVAAELKNANGRLAATYQDLESFSYAISHDLRAPLRAIASFAEILEQDLATGLGEEGRRILDIIRRAARSMDEMVIGLMEFSRAAGLGRALELDTIDMTSLAEVTAREAMLVYRGPTPKIEIGELPDATGDATGIRQVWCNLLGNALKYSAKRARPHVTVTGRIEGQEAIYQVRDNGVGFDMRFAQKLFGIFQRLHRAEEFPGSGVGLAIVQRIIACHGGRIAAESAPEQGASFQFALPRVVS